VVSGSNCEAPVGAALRVPGYAAPPLVPQTSHWENQSILPDPKLPPSTTNIGGAGLRRLRVRPQLVENRRPSSFGHRAMAAHHRHDSVVCSLRLAI
jgi:hypothetical protein